MDCITSWHCWRFSCHKVGVCVFELSQSHRRKQNKIKIEHFNIIVIIYAQIVCLQSFCFIYPKNLYALVLVNSPLMNSMQHSSLYYTSLTNTLFVFDNERYNSPCQMYLSHMTVMNSNIFVCLHCCLLKLTSLI